MFEEIKKEFFSFRLLAILLTIAVGIYLLQIFWQAFQNFSDVLSIVIFGWLLSFILEPLVNLVAKFTRLPKAYAAIIIYAFFALLFTLIIFSFIPLVANQIQTFSKLIPVYIATAPKFVQTWANGLTSSLDNVVSYLPSVANFLASVLIALILSFYIIVDRNRINNELYNLVPKKWHENVHFIQGVIDETFASFLRIQVIFGIMAGIITWVVLRIFNIDFAASIALVAGILAVIPLIGPILALIPPVTLAFIFNPQDPSKALVILVVLAITHQVAFNIVGPKLMGKAFKLHPIVVLVFSLLGFRVAGVLGAIFAVPVLGIIGIVVKKLGYHFINPEGAKS